MQQTVKDKLTQAKTNVVLEQPFFGFLLCQMPVKEFKDCDTAFTDGKVIGYNAEFMGKQSLAKTEGVLAHEVLHIADGHPWRREGREADLWNDACDYAINPILIEAGFELPEGVLVDDRFKGMSPEQIFTVLNAKREEEKGKEQGEDSKQQGATPDANAGASGEGSEGDGEGEGQGQGEGGNGSQGWGEVLDCTGTPEEVEQAKANAQVATIQAVSMAKGQGLLPGGLARRVNEIKNPVVDWRSALAKFVQQTAKADFSWSMPNRRYLASGLYLPEMRSESMPPLVVAVDVSGSIDEGLLASFGAELQSLVDQCKPESVQVVYCDATVQHVAEFQADDLIKLEAHGGGGTDLRKPFEWIAEQGLDPACFVYLTDMAGPMPEVEPGYPVLWAQVGSYGYPAPWGEVVKVQ